MAPNFSKIILGTVQLGMPYGLGRWREELMPESIAFSILDAAWDMGITTLDTSPDYGVAEERIAKYMKLNPSKQFHVISKIKEIDESNQNIKTSFDLWMKNNVFLKDAPPKLLSILLHQERDIFRDGVIDILESLQKREYVSSWGVSAYSKDVASYAALLPHCNIVQLPFGVLNQSFSENGILSLLNTHQKEVHARSIFTKGLLFSNKLGLTGISEDIAHVIGLAQKLSQEKGQTLTQFAMNFVLAFEQIKNVLIGVDDAQQLTELSDCSGDMLDTYELSLLCTAAKNIAPADVRPELWR